jgi:prepilin signal peptidase PulO-like enzyme (type II secretory pathway)
MVPMPFDLADALAQPIVQLIATGYIGLVIGGFMTVLSWRIRQQPAQGLLATIASLSTHSVCPSCQRALSWGEKLPLLGYVACLGRCRGCRIRIPLRYPAIELATAIFFLLIVWPHLGEPSGWIWLADATVVAVLCATLPSKPRFAIAIATIIVSFLLGT